MLFYHKCSADSVEITMTKYIIEQKIYLYFQSYTLDHDKKKKKITLYTYTITYKPNSP